MFLSISCNGGLSESFGDISRLAVPRLELKIAEPVVDCLSILSEAGFIEVFQPRCVESVYFDDDQLSLHNESEEGIVPRYKVRLRSYNQGRDCGRVEMKFTHPHWRSKFTSEEVAFDLTDGSLRVGIWSTEGRTVLSPKIIVGYQRRYFERDGIRATIDYGIKFRDCVSGMRANSTTSVLEFKINRSSKSDFLGSDLALPLGRRVTRMSKYCEGVHLFTDPFA